MGTPAFMPPEQIAGESPTPRWDVFAMGCVMYELATGGVHPFERDTNDATLAAITTGVKLAPSALYDGIEAAIEDAILAALETDPERRAPSCADLLARLDGPRTVARSEPPPVVRPTQVGPVPPTRLETTGPAHARSSWTLASAKVAIGRESADISLGAVAGLEALHCELQWTGTGWLLLDRSTNGTRVNGARVTRIPLEDGDLIRVGHQVLKFHTEAAPAGGVGRSEPETPSVTGPRLEVDRRHAHGDGPDPVVVPIGALPVVIGRGPGCALRLSEPLAAEQHCRVSLQGLDVVVEDLGSRSGTFVDGQRVRFRSLREGATLTIGEARIRFRLR
jgi:pSer/pThr/pTyr-binding forkhead associated (FHA) protein